MPKFLNIAHESSAQPSLVNVDTIARIRPGSCSGNGAGRDEQCCMVFIMNADQEYDGGETLRETYEVDIHLPVREIVRRMTTELLVI